jgi:hypothetical protein
MTEPTYTATLRAHVAAEARALVRSGLDWCPTCQASASLPCRTAGGTVARRWHVARGRA